MLYNQLIEYAYVRLRSTYQEDDGKDVVYVFAALRQVKNQMLGEVVRQQVKSIVTKSVTLPVEEAPAAYLTFPHETVYDLERQEFERLKVVAEEDRHQFFIYRTEYDLQSLS